MLRMTCFILGTTRAHIRFFLTAHFGASRQLSTPLNPQARQNPAHEQLPSTTSLQHNAKAAERRRRRVSVDHQCRRPRVRRSQRQNGRCSEGARRAAAQAACLIARDAVWMPGVFPVPDLRHPVVVLFIGVRGSCASTREFHCHSAEGLSQSMLDLT